MADSNPPRASVSPREIAWLDMKDGRKAIRQYVLLPFSRTPGKVQPLRAQYFTKIIGRDSDPNIAPSVHPFAAAPNPGLGVPVEITGRVMPTDR